MKNNFRTLLLSSLAVLPFLLGAKEAKALGGPLNFGSPASGTGTTCTPSCVNTFNGRSGSVVFLNSDLMSVLTGADIIAALGYTPLQHNETITLSGDVSGSGATAITTTLATVVSAGTYTKVTVDIKGRVTTGAQIDSGDVTTALGYTPLQHNETITLSGDCVGTGTTAITTACGSAPPLNSVLTGGGSVSFAGVPLASVKRLFVFPYTCTIPLNLTGTFASQGLALTAATGATDFALSFIHAGSSTSVGNVSFAGGSKVPTFPSHAAISVVAGDAYELDSPATPDATLADISITIACQKI